MTEKKSPTSRKLSEAEIDSIVVTQAADNSAWKKAVHVHKKKSAAVFVPEEAGARAHLLFRK